MLTRSGYKFCSAALVFAGALALVQSAKATTVTAVICNNADFLCNQPGDVVIDSGIRTDLVGLLGASQYTLLPFNFADALMSFSGTVVAADAGAKFIYLWGTGTASTVAAPAGDYLDVTITQSYLTVPGPWGFSEIDVGTCNAVAQANASTSEMVGVVNGAALPVLGAAGDCANAPFAFAAGPGFTLVPAITTMTAAAQFFFAGGAAGQTITLPWGDDFPDPTINFNDPNNPFNFITNTDIPAGFTLAPEPAMSGLFGGGLLVAVSVWRRRGRRSH